MNNKYLVVGVIFLLFFNFVSAEIIGDNESYNFFENLLYKLKGIGLFTAAGQARECSDNADYSYGPVGSGTEDTYSRTDSFVVTTSTLLNRAGCSVALFNTFDSNWHFKKEARSEDVGGVLLYKGTTGTSTAIVEVYCCPYPACDSDSDCLNDGLGTDCNTNYGSCYGDIPSHSTKVYKCSDGDWDYIGRADYGEDNWCSDDDDNNYIPEGQNSGGCYTSAPSGWCVADEPDKTCSELGTDMNTCFDRSDCIWTRYSNCKTTSNAGCTGMREQDCLQGSNCEWTGTTCQVVNEGECENQDTKCEGEIYYTCENEVWESQGRIDGECGYEDGGVIDANTLTWTEFYSITNEKFAKGNYFCSSDSDCPTKEGYTIICSYDEIFAERTWNYYYEQCDKELGFWDELLSLSNLFLPDLLKVDICEDIYANFKIKWNNNGAGICLAESDTWYGGLWEGTLKTFGEMGIPYQYGMIFTIMILFTLIGMIVRFIK